jgi:hypothetical protein
MPLTLEPLIILLCLLLENILSNWELQDMSNRLEHATDFYAKIKLKNNLEDDLC